MSVGQMFAWLAILMSITLKEFAHFMVDFVNKSFLPLIKAGVPDHDKCLEHWKHVTDLINDIQNISYWNLQSCLKHIAWPNTASESKDMRQYKKSENNRSGGMNYKTYDNFFEKKEQSIPTYDVEDPSKTNHSFKSNHKDHSQPKNKPFNYNTIDKEKHSLENNKNESINDNDGFEKLIQSFRKLCHNFENNHKKLLREDQNYKQNFKEEITHF